MLGLPAENIYNISHSHTGDLDDLESWMKVMMFSRCHFCSGVKNPIRQPLFFTVFHGDHANNFDVY